MGPGTVPTAGALSNIENQQLQTKKKEKPSTDKVKTACSTSTPQVLLVVDDDSKPAEIKDLGAVGSSQTVVLRPPFCLF
jgi:hypothetical protein